MVPATLPWQYTETGAQVALGQLGLLIVRKVQTDFLVVIFGKALQARSVTIDDGKARAEAAARRWVAQAAALLWSKDEPTPEVRRRSLRPVGKEI